MNFKIAIVGLVIAGGVLPATADWFIDNGSYNSVSSTTDLGVTNNIYVGVEKAANLLEVLPGVGLGAGDLYVGSFNTTSNNAVGFGQNSQGSFNNLVVGGSLSGIPGRASTGNSMIITNGAQVFSQRGLVGTSANADGNTVTIGGAGAFWVGGSEIVVGWSGANNSLTVTDSAGVYANQVFLGINQGADSNALSVTGGILDAGGRLVVGDAGSYNTAELLGGTEAAAASATIGGSDIGTGNVLRVSGSGTVFRVAGALTVGATNNADNVAYVDDGATIALNELIILGANNRFELSQDGILDVGSDFDAAMSGFSFGTGGTLRVAGELTELTAVEDQRKVELYSTNGLWNAAGGSLLVGATSSSNALGVVDGAQLIAETLVLGGVSNAYDNLVVVSNGGHVALGDSLAIAGSNNVFNLASGGALTVSNDFNAGMAGFVFGSNSALEVQGELSGITGRVDNDQLVRVNGGSWDTTAAPLVLENGTVELLAGGLWNSTNVDIRADGAAWIQDAGTLWTNQGTLGLSDGAFLLITNGAAALTEETTFDGSAAWIAGAGSSWFNAGDLSILGAGGDLRIFDDAMLDVGGALRVGLGSSISLEDGGAATATDFMLDSTSTLYFDSVVSNGLDTGTALIDVANSASFDAGATIAYIGGIEVLDPGVTNSRKIVASSQLIVGGVTNAVGDDLDVLNGLEDGSLLQLGFLSQNDDLYALLLRASLAESAGFEDGTMMANLSNEIDDLATTGDQQAINQLKVLNGMNSTTQNSQLRQLYERNAPNYAHMAGMAEGLRQVRERGVMPDEMWPVGAQGPHFYGEQVQVWARGYGSWGTRSESDVYAGYQQMIYGALLGFDKSYGDLLVGVGGGYASSDISVDDGDSSVAGTGYGLAYANWGTRSWFVDGGLAYGVSSVEQSSGTAFNNSADFSANQFAYNLHVGHEMIFRRDTLFLTPEVGLVGGWYGQEAYTESATNAKSKQVDAYDYWSFRSEVGLRASWERQRKKSIMTPRAKLAWLHEFNAGEQQVGYTLAGGTGRYTFGMQAPVEDLIETGLGVSFWRETKKGNAVEWAFDVDGRFGDGYTAAAFNARWMVQF